MTRLSQVSLLTRDIEINGSTVTIRGLSLSDLLRVLPRYGTQIAMLFGKAVSQQSFSPDNLSTVVQVFATEAPDLVAEVIALACDDYSDEAKQVALRLPVTKQIEMLEAIYSNSFTSEGDIKKFREVITRIVLAAAMQMEQMTPAILSAAGIGAFADKSAS